MPYRRNSIAVVTRRVALPTAVRRRSRSRSRDDRRRIRLVPHNPLGALNSARTNGAALTRPLRPHRTAAGPDLAGRIAELLQHVGLEADFAGRRPHELSGRQRVAVAPTVSAP